MFPVLVVTRPAATSSRDRASAAFPAPRILNEPIGCRFSSLSQISAGASSTWSRTSGVRIAVPASRSRAASMSASGIRKSNLDAHASLSRAPENEFRRREVLDRDAERLEDGQLVLVLAAWVRPEQHLAELGLDVVRAEGAFRRGDEVVAGLVQGGLAPIDERASVRHRLRVELARRPDAGTDCVHVCAAGEPALLDDRLLRRRRRAHDLCTEERRVDRRRDRGADLAGELFGCLEPPRPDPDLGIVEHGPHRVDVASRLRSRSQDRDALRVRPRERAGRDCRDGRRADLGDRRRIHDRDELARLSVVEQDAAHVRVEAARRVRRDDDDLLQRVGGRGSRRGTRA